MKATAALHRMSPAHNTVHGCLQMYYSWLAVVSHVCRGLTMRCAGGLLIRLRWSTPCGATAWWRCMRAATSTRTSLRTLPHSPCLTWLLAGACCAASMTPCAHCSPLPSAHCECIQSAIRCAVQGRQHPCGICTAGQKPRQRGGDRVCTLRCVCIGIFITTMSDLQQHELAVPSS